jgi:hypothetical protein
MAGPDPAIDTGTIGSRATLRALSGGAPANTAHRTVDSAATAFHRACGITPPHGTLPP